MKKLVALAIASTFAFGAASTFAAPFVKEQVRVEHRVSGAPAKIEKVHYVKKAHRHHVKRHHRQQRHQRQL